jgi:Tfp pilus assembly protein PilF
MKFAFAILFSFATVLCVNASITKLLTEDQLRYFETVTLNLAQKQYASGKMDEAKQNLLAVLKADPKNATAQYYLRLVEQTKTRPRTPLIWRQTIPQQPILN